MSVNTVSSINDYLYIESKPEWITKAEKKHKRNGILRRSFMNGNRAIYGYVVENAFEEICLNSIIVDNYDFDFINSGCRIDIKTKVYKCVPLVEYEVSIPAYYNQNCDIYVFSRISFDYKNIWFVGWDTKKDYYKKMRKINKGELDLSNGMLAKENMYNCYIYQMRTMKTLEDFLYF